MRALPTGTVTFVFSDVEGSTRLLEADRHGTEAALARHHEIFERIVHDHRGVIFETVGDAVYAAFAVAADAVACALAVQLALAREEWGELPQLRVRVAIHAGEVSLRGDAHYSGAALFRTARLQSLAHGSQTLLSGEVARLIGDSLPADASFHHHGRHRLKDLTEPEEVYELRHPELPDRFPPLRSLDAHPHNLPTQLSSFIGRERELREIVELLGTQRLVTLTGVGGTGKTRLALQAAGERVERHRDGVWFVDLAAIRDPELVVPGIASALGLREQTGWAIDRVLTEYLAERELLLILDNCEQVLGAAPDIGRLLAGTSGLTMLATSRAPLRIRGEREYQVPTLETGDEQSVAVRLFVERAASVRSDLPTDDRAMAAIAEICRLVDGLPLAIELAAARARMFDPGELLRQLEGRQVRLGGGARDAPARQQSLREAIAWSEQLLTDVERRWLHRLAVFAGSFDAEAAAAVGAGDEDAIEILMSLAEQSLLRRSELGLNGEARFGMLDTIRFYAGEQLERSGDDEDARDRMLGHFLSLATGLSDELEGPGLGEAVRRVQAEWPNIHAVLDWGIEGRRPDAARLATKVRQYWVLNGPYRDAQDVFERCIGLELPDRLRAECLHWAGTFAGLMGFTDKARTNLTHAASRLAELGEDRLEGAALNDLGVVLSLAGEFDMAEETWLRSAALCARAGYARGEALATGNLGDVAINAGRLDLAAERLERSLQLWRAVDDPNGISWMLAELARLALDREDVSTALGHGREALRLARRGGDIQSRAEACLALGAVEWARGKVRTAARLLDQAARDAEALGDRDMASRIEEKRAEHQAASAADGGTATPPAIRN